MGNEAKYRAKVLNIDGYVVMFPNVGEGVPKLTMPPNPYAQSVTQLFPLGTKLIQGERVWRYAKAGGTNLNIAAPVQQAKAIHAEQNDDIVVVLGTISTYKVTLTSTANLAAAPLSTKDGIAEGYLIVNDEAGQGQMYKIKSHEAMSGTANSIFTLYDALTIALTTSSQVGLIQNPYANVIATEAPVSGMVIGVPLIAVTTLYYFWCQTGGPAPIVAQAAIVLGSKVMVGTTAAKVNTYSTTSTTQLEIGYAMTPGVLDTEEFIVFLTLDR